MVQFLPFLQRWILKGGTAILDQGIFSGAIFILNLLLARWLAPSLYAAFAVAFIGFHNAIILEPMNVLGSTTHHLPIEKWIARFFETVKDYLGFYKGL